MSATRLLVLGLVRTYGRAHGYLVGQQLLAWEADKWANTKTGSIYHALRQLTKEGMLVAREVPSSESGPPRTDYEITETGVAEFQRLVKLALTEPEPRPDMLCAGLAFISALPRATALDYLRERLAVLAGHKAAVKQATDEAEWSGDNALPPHVDALLSFWTFTSASSHDWVQGLIDKIDGGAYIFADEDQNAFGNPNSRSAPA
jgi:DNA-binding PadR family transcriptional regulator